MRIVTRTIFDRALAEASIEKAFERNLDCERGVLRVRDDLYDLSSYSRVFVVSFGKAAHTLLDALQARAGSRFEGIVASSVDPASQVRGFRYFKGGHPTPNEDSVRAAEAMLKSLSAQDASSLIIFLISGGGSAIVEKAIDEEVLLDDIIATYRELVRSSAPIAEINTIRKHLSAVKGGRLAVAAAPAPQLSILISDVPDNMPNALASGPTMPDSTTVQDCYDIVECHRLLSQFPEPVRELFERHALEETPKSDDPAFLRSRWWTLLSNRDLVEAARVAAGQVGLHCEIDNSCDDWDFARAADYLLGRVRELRKQHPYVCLISGGEITVKATGNGTGGRNQHFALACAAKISGENIAVLSAGSDGIDGNSAATGAVADGTTVSRAEFHGLKVEDQLARFDAFPLFEKLGDAIITGPTGNNIRDLRILIAY